MAWLYLKAWQLYAYDKSAVSNLFMLTQPKAEKITRVTISAWALEKEFYDIFIENISIISKLMKIWCTLDIFYVLQVGNCCDNFYVQMKEDVAFEQSP